MNDAGDLLRIIKKAATEAVDASIPVMVCFGDVVEVKPLRVKLNQKITLEGEQLKKIKGLDGIGEGSTLLLLRQQGGQTYFILGVM